MSDLGLDVGQANELKLAFRRYPYDNADIKRLCETDVLGDALGVLRGDAKVVLVKRIVDLNAAPVLGKDDLSVVKHLKQGRKPWAKVRLALMRPEDLQYTYWSVPERLTHQTRRKFGDHTKINRRTMMPRFLRGQRPANICMRDFLLANQHLVRQDWNFIAKPILFWGTILNNGHCDYVPGIQWSYGKWTEYGRRISSREMNDVDNDYDNPCVVLAPTSAW